MKIAIFGFILFHCVMSLAAWGLWRIIPPEYPVRKYAAGFFSHVNLGYALAYLVLLSGAI